MTDLKPGTVVLGDDRALTVDSFPTSHTVAFTNGAVAGREWTETNVSPVQPGDTLVFGAGLPRKVTDVVYSTGRQGFLVFHQNRDNPGIGLSHPLKDAEVVLVAKEPETPSFATGSKVRFRRDVTYTVVDFDGELHELTPDDGSETLHFSPDLFELISPPPLESGAVVCYDGQRWLVDYESGGLIGMTNSEGRGTTVSREAFHESGEVLLP